MDWCKPWDRPHNFRKPVLRYQNRENLLEDDDPPAVICIASLSSALPHFMSPSSMRLEAEMRRMEGKNARFEL